MKATVILAALLLPALAACQSTAARTSTASGRPEVTISGKPLPAIKGALLSRMLDNGYRVTRDDASTLTVEKEASGVLAPLLLSTPAGGSPNVRIVYTFAEIGWATRVVADMAIISNPGTTFEKRIDMSQSSEAPKVQGYLDSVGGTR